MDKSLEYYLNLPYTRELIPDEDGKWFVQIKELPGCMSQGDTPEHALRMIDEAMHGWLEVSLEDGDLIPEPREDEAFSGKFVARVPKSLHRKLVETADGEGVSLNQFVSSALAEAVGEEKTRKAEKSSPQQDIRQAEIHIALEKLCRVSGLDHVERNDLEKAYSARMQEELTMCFRYVENGNNTTAGAELYALAREINRNAANSPLLSLFGDVLLKMKQLVEQPADRTAKPKSEEISFLLGSNRMVQKTSYSQPAEKRNFLAAEPTPGEYRNK